MKMFIAGETDQHRLTVHGLSYLRDLDRETEHCRRWRHQPFWACRCLRSELRRMIRALATRTASALADGFFGSGVFAAPAVGIMVDGVAAIEPWPTGCTLIGPVDVGLLPGIMDNARRPNSFDARKRPACRTRSPTPLAEPGR